MPYPVNPLQIIASYLAWQAMNAPKAKSAPVWAGPGGSVESNTIMAQPPGTEDWPGIRQYNPQEKPGSQTWRMPGMWDLLQKNDPANQITRGPY